MSQVIQELAGEFARDVMALEEHECSFSRRSLVIYVAELEGFSKD